MDQSELFHDPFQEIWQIEQATQENNTCNPKTLSPSILKDFPSEKNIIIQKICELSPTQQEKSKSTPEIGNEENSKENQLEQIKKEKNSLTMMITVNSLMYPTINLPSSINDRVKIFTNRKEKRELINLRCLQNFYQEKKNKPEYLTLNEKSNAFRKNPTENSVWVIKFSIDGNFMAAGGSDAILRVYETNKNIDLLEIININCSIYKFHQSDIVDLAWNNDSTKILTASMDFKAILWERGHPIPLKVFQHFDIITCCLFNPERNDSVYTGGFDKILRLWDIESEAVLSYFHTPDFISSMAFSPNNSLLVLGFVQGYARIYKMINKKLEFLTEIQCKNKRKLLLPSKGKKISNIQFIDNRYFFVTTNDSRIRLIDTANFKQIMKYKGFKNEKIHIKSDYCYEREMILSGSEDGKVYLWNKVSDYIPVVNPKYIHPKTSTNASYEFFVPFDKDFPICCVVLPVEFYDLAKKKLLKKGVEGFCDLMILTVSNKSQFKIYGNFIGL